MRTRFVSYFPLVVFTGVFPVAVGMILPAAFVLCLPGVVPRPIADERTILKTIPFAHRALVFVTPAGLLGIAALLVASLHLGRKLRAPLAGLRFGRSWLSTEVVLAGVFVVAAMLSSPWTRVLEVGSDRRGLVLLAALAGLGAVVALARVYALPGQPGWRGVDRTAAPPVAMALTASLVWWVTARPECGGIAGVLLVVMLLLDTALAAVRSGRLVRSVRRRDPSLEHRGAARAAARLVPVRFVAVALLLAALGSVDPVRPRSEGSLEPWVIAVLVAASLLDRFAFYAGTARSSPRTVVAGLRRDRLTRAARAASAVTPAHPRMGR